MALRDALVNGRADLSHLATELRLELGSFLTALREAKAIVTGVPVLLLAAGLWQERRRLRPGACVVDVLYSAPGARSIMRTFLERAGYTVVETRCCHRWGEWGDFPRDRVLCMTRGQFKQRALHLVQLPRGPVETALSRAYGSAIGTYLTGGGRLVSLFPSLTLVYRQCWLPLRFISRARAFVAFKYIPWELIEWNENVEVEIAAVSRTVADGMTQSVCFNATTGSLLSETECRETEVSLWRPQGGVMGQMMVQNHSSAVLFPSMKACLNANGNKFDVSMWMWPDRDGRG